MHQIRKSLEKFAQLFFHPRIFIFILTGAGIIFLTFLTSNNALEIAISGIASVFIGIGVNNFSTLETHQKDEKKLNDRVIHFMEILDLVNARIGHLQNEIREGRSGRTKEELEELRRFISLMIQLVKEDISLN
jgi:uncharacterized membrane protein